MPWDGRSYAVLLTLQPGAVPATPGQFHYLLLLLIYETSPVANAGAGWESAPAAISGSETNFQECFSRNHVTDQRVAEKGKVSNQVQKFVPTKLVREA